MHVPSTLSLAAAAALALLPPPARAATARGTFEVEVAPAAEPEKYPEGTVLQRYSLDKTYRGGLEGSAKGEMLTGGTPVEGSAVYVALERVSATLDGRKGTFLLHHLGTMGHGAQRLAIAVVADSGTGELVGLAGTLDIQIAADGTHSYALEYTLPAKP